MKRMVLVTLLLALGVALIGAPRGRAGDKDDKDNKDNDESKIKRGFEIAPVHLNLRGKNRELVGLGSYIVNAVADCNGCHYAPPSPFAPGGDPFQGEPKQVDSAGYLGGGNSLFAPSPFTPRNLTPDKTGRPEGGATYKEFRDIMRTGIDPDQAHLFIGNPYLQIMPWPAFQDMTDHDLRAIYEYLSAIPCVEGDPGLPNPRPIGTRCRH